MLKYVVKQEFMKYIPSEIEVLLSSELSFDSKISVSGHNLRIIHVVFSGKPYPNLVFNHFSNNNSSEI